MTCSLSASLRGASFQIDTYDIAALYIPGPSLPTYTILLCLPLSRHRHQNIQTTAGPTSCPPFSSYAASSRAPQAQAQCPLQRRRRSPSSTRMPSLSSLNLTAHTAAPPSSCSPSWAQSTTPSSSTKSVRMHVDANYPVYLLLHPTTKKETRNANTQTQMMALPFKMPSKN